MTTSTVDPRWRDAFVIALRMRDVPSDAIADHLKVVETHCAESGESPTEAFGDPTTYAESITPEQSGSERIREVGMMIPPAVVGLLAGMLLVEGVIGLANGRPVEVTVGDIAGSALLVVAAILMVTLVFRLRRPLVPSFALALGGVVTAVLLDLRLTTHVADLPAWLALVIALVFVAVFVITTARAARGQRITDPVTGEPML